MVAPCFSQSMTHFNRSDATGRWLMISANWSTVAAVNLRMTVTTTIVSGTPHALVFEIREFVSGSGFARLVPFTVQPASVTVFDLPLLANSVAASIQYNTTDGTGIQDITALAEVFCGALTAATAAVVRPFWYGLSAPGGVLLSTQDQAVYEPGGVLAVSGGPAAAPAFTWSVTDTLTDVTLLTVPPAHGTTRYAFLKQIALHVVTPASPATTISNAAVRLYNDLDPGLRLFYRANPNYIDQSVTPAAPADIVQDDPLLGPVTPPGYQIATVLSRGDGRVYTDDVSTGIWDPMGTLGNGGTAGRISMFLDLVLGVSFAVSFLPFEIGLPRVPYYHQITPVFTYSELAQPGT